MHHLGCRLFVELLFFYFARSELTLVKINGKEEAVAGISLSDYLKDNGYNPESIVIELNGEILNRNNYSSVVLQENDVVEILMFMGGG